MCTELERIQRDPNFRRLRDKAQLVVLRVHLERARLCELAARYADETERTRQFAAAVGVPVRTFLRAVSEAQEAGFLAWEAGQYPILSLPGYLAASLSPQEERTPRPQYPSDARRNQKRLRTDSAHTPHTLPNGSAQHSAPSHARADDSIIMNHESMMMNHDDESPLGGINPSSINESNPNQNDAREKIEAKLLAEGFTPEEIAEGWERCAGKTLKEPLSYLRKTLTNRRTEGTQQAMTLPYAVPGGRTTGGDGLLETMRKSEARMTRFEEELAANPGLAAMFGRTGT